MAKRPVQTVKHPDAPERKASGVPMMVRAHQPGYYGCYRDIGTVFQIRDQENDFSEEWMVEHRENDAPPAPEPNPLEPVPLSDTQSVI